MSVSDIGLRNPWWLLLALQPLLVWLIIWLRSRSRTQAFADPALLPWVLSTRRVSRVSGLRPMALWLAWCCLAVAMAGPRTLQGIVGQDTTRFLSLQIVVDESYSMAARDVAPSRLQRAALELQDLVERLQQVRAGIVVYADRPHVMIPLTSDKRILRQSLESLRVRQLPTEGSNLYAALQFAQQQFHNRQTTHAILLVSDGGVTHDDTASLEQLNDLVGSLARQGTHLYVLGVGTTQGAPLLNDQNGWLKQAGRSVITHLAAARLRALAQLGNGSYSEVEDDDSDWQRLYDRGIGQLALREQAGDHGQRIWRDLSPWFVFPGMLFLLLAYVRFPSRRIANVSSLLVLSILVAALHSHPAQAATQDYASAWHLYQGGDFQQAARVFAQINGYRARMAEAASWYQLKNYPKAATLYIQALLEAETDQQRAAALFNLGNSYYQQQDYTRAASTYRDVLRYHPNDRQARINLDFAEALIEKGYRAPSVGGRAGTGYHTAPARPDTEVGKGRVSIDGSEQHGQMPLPEIDSQTQTDNDKLLQQARPASSKITLDKDLQWTYDITQPGGIQPQDIHFNVDASSFWQRLYEAEEGFPAPRERPEIVPGVAPW